MQESSVRFHSVPLHQTDGFLGVATLNRPKVLNALDHTMIRELLEVMVRVDNDVSIKALWIESSTEKAFCAGGDVRDVTNNGQAGGLKDLQNSSDYLADEYLLDVWLRECKKPVFAWGDGYIMGGGMGILQGADVRFVTQHSNLAMPEVRIGFVPDCGASWFLNRVPNGLGICLAMSGATVSSADGHWLNLADWVLPRAEKDALMDKILGLNYESKIHALSKLGQILNQEITECRSQGLWEIHGAILGNSIRHQSPVDVWRAMQQWHHDEPQIFKGLEQASPGAAMVAGHQFQRAKHQSLIATLLQEHDLAMRFLNDGEWCEGVRALLIDKDKKPKWRFQSVNEVTADWIRTMLAPMDWTLNHPLGERLEARTLPHN